MTRTEQAVKALETLRKHAAYLRLPNEEIEEYKDTINKLLITIAKGDR